MNSIVTADVPAAARTLAIFETFGAERRPLSLSELARLADIPVSSCHSLMRTLERRGFLHFLSAREAYPTRKMLDVATAINAHDPIALRLAPALAALRDETGETVILGSRQGNAALYLLVLESAQTVRYTARAGEHKPLHSSSIGKVLLAEMAPDDLDSWISNDPLKRATPQTITSARQLKRDLEESRLRGWFVTRGENVTDVMAIAAPLHFGGITLGVAIAGPMHRMVDVERRQSQRLLTAIKAIERQNA
ncbi:MAG: IclR family transcriptional regulator [Lautropia sp.]